MTRFDTTFRKTWVNVPEGAAGVPWTYEKIVLMNRLVASVLCQTNGCGQLFRTLDELERHLLGHIDGS